MPYSTLISVDDLRSLQASGAPLMVFDCSFDLMNPAAADELYRSAHIAGAVQAHLDRDLTAHDEADAACGGRHPLPSRSAFAQWLSQVGFTNTMQAVVYDRNGANYCARLWWMLQWAGHPAAAVLDGGLQAWQTAGGAIASGPSPRHPASNFQLQPALREMVTADTVLSRLGQPGQTLIDARAPQRFRGEIEPLDPVAGHIPGALNRPFGDNLDATGRFKPATTLRDEFNALLAGQPAAQVVHHCGSGVSACPNLLAMEVAGLSGSRLYAGSWSEWCRDPQRPVAQG